MQSIVKMPLFFALTFANIAPGAATSAEQSLTIEEIPLHDVRGESDLEDFYIQRLDSATKGILNVWSEREKFIPRDHVADSITLTGLGYSFHPKKITLTDSFPLLPTNRTGYDIFRFNKCIVPNSIGIPLVLDVDSVRNAIIIRIRQALDGRYVQRSLYNDTPIDAEEMNPYDHFSPKLYKGKPLYVARGSCKNREDSIRFFRQPIWSAGPAEPELDTMKYPFYLMLGSKRLFTFRYSRANFFAPIPERIIFKTLVYNSGWVLECENIMVINGIDEAKKNRMSECFYSGPIGHKICFFYKKDGYYGIFYGDRCLPNRYDYIIYHGCCSAAFLNPEYFKTAVRFFAEKNKRWYLVIAHL
jgi:hypothetical protein